MEVILSQRAVLEIQGEDAERFLQGLLTQDIQSMGSVAYSFLLSSKGRVIADLFVYRIPLGFWVEVDEELVDRVYSLFQLYKVRSRVHIIKCPDLCVKVCWNQENAKTLEGYHGDPRLSDLGFRGVFHTTSVADEDVSGLQKWIYHRYDRGIPEGSLEIPPDKAISLEYNGDYVHGVSFTKGCYVGQELTARTKFVGSIRKRILPYVVIEDKGITKEDVVCIYEQEVGFVVANLDNRGLMMIRVDECEFKPGKPIIVENQAGSICEVFIPRWLSLHIEENHESS